VPSRCQGFKGIFLKRATIELKSRVRFHASGAVLRWGGGTCPQIHLLPADSKASWKNFQAIYFKGRPRYISVRIFSVSENG